MMKNKMAGLIIGGLITAAVLGATYGVSNAAKSEPVVAEQNTMMQQGQMNSKDMQKQCGEMMASPEMQKNMKDMMKQMMSSDPEMKQMMINMMKNAENKNTANAE
jgi:hypothetical protein